MPEAGQSSQRTTTTAVSNQIVVKKHSNPPTDQAKPVIPPPDLVTFQFEGSCVLVKSIASYQDAQAMAQREFHELWNVPKERLGFTFIEPGSTFKNIERKEIRISEGAWSTVMRRMPQNSTVYVIIRPDPDAKPQPPQYLEVPGVANIQEVSGLRHSRSNLSSSSHSSNRSSKSGSGLLSLSWIGSGK